MATKNLQDIIEGMALSPEAEAITDMPLGARAPAKAYNAEIAPRKGRAHKPLIAQHRIEPIPRVEIAQAKPKAEAKGRTQEDYYKAVRELTRRPVGRKAVPLAEQVETVMGLVGGLKRKDR